MPLRILTVLLQLYQLVCSALPLMFLPGTNDVRLYSPSRRHDFRCNIQQQPNDETILDTNNDNMPQTTIIANTTFRLPTAQHLGTISTHQVHHPLTENQTFCVSKNFCKHCHPQSFGFHPTAGSKLSSGLFRLSCPLLVQAIDDWEATGGIREMSDWLMRNDTFSYHASDQHELNWKQTGYQNANAMQKQIRQELVSSEDESRLIEKLGAYNAKKFMESGIAGIPSEQTFDVKCIHAHVADHLCRVTSDPESNESTLDAILRGEGNIIGQRALQLLHNKGIQILGNDVCWQQCSGSEGWRYIARKNRRGLKSTRSRRKKLRNIVESNKY